MVAEALLDGSKHPETRKGQGAYPIQPQDQKQDNRQDVDQRQLPLDRQRSEVLHNRQARRVLRVVILPGIIQLVVELVDPAPLIH